MLTRKGTREMTMRISCAKCDAPLDVFDVKPHKCKPKVKLVNELTVKELQVLLRKAQEK